MRYLLPLIVLITICIHTPITYAQGATEPLLEVPVHPIPEGMTYEDYEAANMRISTGLIRGVLPGGVHFYAKEDTMGWALASTATLGLIAIVVGSTLTEEAASTEGDQIVNFNNGDQYQKIPTSRIEDSSGQVTQTEYSLRKLPSEQLNDTGSTLVGLGAIALIGSYIYDVLHGMEVIESKRSKARYKFGKSLNSSHSKKESSLYFRPQLDTRRGNASLLFGMSF